MVARPSILNCPGISIERDAQGRVARRVVAFGGNAVEVRRYAYDAAGRLTRVTDDTGALCESYQYDREGRRLTDINPRRFRGERRFVYAAGNRLSQADRVQFRHDASGFRCLKVEDLRETRYRYEPSGLLLGVDLPDGRRIEYAYDARGQRTEKRVDGRIVEAYRWLDPLRLLEFYAGGEWWRLAYDLERDGRTPVGVTNGRDSFLLHSDHLGTPLVLAGLDGNVVQAMRYDAFGNLLETRGDAVRLPIGFAGGLFDADTGLTRFFWRDYDADTGRFTALDPLGARGGDSDWYGYCVDDPVNRKDAWGLFWGEETPGGRIVWSGLKTAGSWGAKGAIIGLPIEGVGSIPAAVTGAAIGFPYGLFEGTVKEIASDPIPPIDEAEKQSERTQTQRDVLDWPDLRGR